jgi:hypothetical protein
VNVDIRPPTVANVQAQRMRGLAMEDFLVEEW